MMLARATLLALAASGCAHVSELPDGSRRVVGFVSMTVPAAIAVQRRGGELLEVTTLGLLVMSSPATTSVSLGYASERVTTVRNNALVQFSHTEETP
jgi:hypothetical protein